MLQYHCLLRKTNPLSKATKETNFVQVLSKGNKITSISMESPIAFCFNSHGFLAQNPAESCCGWDIIAYSPQGPKSGQRTKSSGRATNFTVVGVATCRADRRRHTCQGTTIIFTPSLASDARGIWDLLCRQVVSRDPTLVLFIPGVALRANPHMARGRRCCCRTGTFFIAFCHARRAKACRSWARSGPAVGGGHCRYIQKADLYICIFFSWFLSMRKCKFR